MIVKKSIGAKLMISIAAVLTAMLLIMTFMTQSVASRMMTRQVEQMLDSEGENLSNEVDRQIIMAISLIMSLKANPTIVAFMEKFTDNNTYKDIPEYKNAMSTLDGAMISDIFVSTYIGNEKTGKCIDSEDWQQPDGYDLDSRDWYSQTKQGSGQMFNEPYVDADSGETVVTVSTAVNSAKDGYLGAVAIDIKCGQIIDAINSYKLYKTGHAMLLTTEGNILTSPVKNEMDAKKITGLGPGMAGIAESILKNDSGLEKIVLGDAKNYVSYSRIKDSNMIVAIIAPESEVLEEVRMLVMIIFVTSAAALIAALIVIWLISMGLTKSIKYFSSLFTKIGEGDISISVDANYLKKVDEIGVLGRSAHNMIDMLNRVMSAIVSSSEEVNSSSDRMKQYADGLEGGVEIQRKVSDNLKEISVKLRENTAESSKNAQNSNSLADKAKESALAGNEHMKEMLVSMEDISQAAGEIAKIIKVIDDIAFQTNILALNAAVEAARAGQQGKGFAIVAEEVRNLASRSSTAANETSVIINKATEKTKNGMLIANSTAAALADIVRDIEKTSDIVNNIAKESLEQNDLISDMCNSVQEIEPVVQAIMQSAHDSAEISDILSQQACNLDTEVNRFEIGRNSLRPLLRA